MSTAFLDKIKTGQARAQRTGYSGKGLERIERKRDEKERAEKHTYGDTSEAVSLSSRDGAVIPYKAKTNEYKPPDTSMKGEGDYTFTEINVEVVHGPAPDRILMPSLYSGKNPVVQLPPHTIAAIEKAKSEGKNVDAGNLAKIIARLHQTMELTKQERMGLMMLQEAQQKRKDPDATDWHAVFPINDYPQKARWKVTNKEQMMLLAEHSQASITMRGEFLPHSASRHLRSGIYYAPGEEPKIGAEAKLHLLIESNDENRVRLAVDEIRRLLVEGSVQALNNADRAGAASARYNV